MGIRGRIGLAVVVATLLGSAAASAEPILNTGAPLSAVRVIASDGEGASDAASAPDPLVVTALGSYSQIALDGAAANATGYELSAAAFAIDFAFARPGGSGADVLSDGSLFFTVTEDVAFTLAGDFTTGDPDPRWVAFAAELVNVDTGQTLFHNLQASESTPNESFALGGAAGDAINELGGQLTGTLLAGFTYRFSHTVQVLNFGAPETDGGAGASGSLTLTFGGAVTPPPAVPLPGAAWAGLALLAGVGVTRRLRRRTDATVAAQ